MDTRLLVQCRARVFLEKYQSRKSGCWYSRAVKVEMPASPAKAVPVVEAKEPEPEPEDDLYPNEKDALENLVTLTSLEWLSLKILGRKHITELYDIFLRAGLKDKHGRMPF
jgi:hypothetical protein